MQNIDNGDYFKYNILGGFGYQVIADNPAQPTFRLMTELGVDPISGISVFLGFDYNTAASSTIVGDYSFTSTDIKVKYNFKMKRNNNMEGSLQN